MIVIKSCIHLLNKENMQKQRQFLFYYTNLRFQCGCLKITKQIACQTNGCFSSGIEHHNALGSLLVQDAVIAVNAANRVLWLDLVLLVTRAAHVDHGSTGRRRTARSAARHWGLTRIAVHSI
jgi:hypothetical protein